MKVMAIVMAKDIVEIVALVMVGWREAEDETC